ncbi:MAG: hypothetical protein PHS97_00315 [Oscillospiraceae bacterium]|nr:hypothetical protein [Oscillospiraceae bacterium]
MEQKNSGKVVWIAIVAAVLVTGILIAVFFALQSTGDRSEIVLPSGQSSHDAPAPTQDDGASLVEVSVNNVQTVIAGLSRPAAYRQSFSIQSAWDDAAASSTVTMYVADAVTKADIAMTGRDTQHLLTDGKVAYLWYGSEYRYRALQLDESVTSDDLTHIPTYEDVLQYDVSLITAASYVFEEDKDILLVQCVDGDYSDTFRIDLSTGLLCAAQTDYLDRTIYQMSEMETASFSKADPVFRQNFLLPDGTNPFSEE